MNRLSLKSQIKEIQDRKITPDSNFTLNFQLQLGNQEENILKVQLVLIFKLGFETHPYNQLRTREKNLNVYFLDIPEIINSTPNATIIRISREGNQTWSLGHGIQKTRNAIKGRIAKTSKMIEDRYELQGISRVTGL